MFVGCQLLYIYIYLYINCQIPPTKNKQINKNLVSNKNLQHISYAVPECLSFWIQHWNFLIICLASPYNGVSLIIRELLLGPYIILNGFLAWWRIHFGRVLTPAFIPSFLLDEGHSLYLQNDFSLFSFIPAFLPSSTPGHESENLTPHRRGE